MSSDSIWALGSYTFPESLTLINDTAIENIIADIPFLGIGLLGFGVITFFLVMKQIKLPSLVLHASVIIAFFGALFDLSQLISRGRNHSSASAFVSGLVTARDIFLSVATGFRFLFFWLYVAEPPRGETAIPLAHSGTWGRWGLLGLVLKWILLALTLAISILQIIWRVSSYADQNGFGTVYGAESAMEIIASAVLLMKLILNVSITSVAPRYNALRDYSAVIVALSINLGIGIGNVATFAFSESVLGRFFIAIEIYILIVYTLVAAFRDHVLVKPAGNIEGKAAVENRPEVKRKADIESNPPRFLTTTTTTSNLNIPRNDDRVASVRRTPSSSRFATWIMPRKDVHRRSIGEGDRVDLWNQAEGADTVVQTATIGPTGRGSPYSYQSFIDEERAGRASPRALSLVNPGPGSSSQDESESRWAADTSESDPNTFSSTRGAEAPARDSTDSLRPPRMPQLDAKSSYSIGSYYGRDPTPADAQPAARESDSPIYALDGILRGAQENRDPSGSAGRLRDSGTSVNSLSFGELLRQQSELDNSIAALRLFAPQQARIASPAALGVSRSPSGGSSRIPPSLHDSDISLDDFPEPPNLISVTANGMPPRPPPSLRVKAIKQNRRSVRDSDNGAYLPMPTMPVMSDFDFPLTPRSIPSSPVRNSGDAVPASRTGVDSVGTQYDVTSFIGNFMNPSSFKKSSALDNLADIQSEDGLSEVNESSETGILPVPEPSPRPPKMSLRAKPAYLDSSLLAVDRAAVPYSPATASSGIWTARRLTDERFQPRNAVAANTNLAGPPRGDALPAIGTADASLSPLSLNSALSNGSGSLSARRLPPPAGSLPTGPRLTVSPPKPASPPGDSEGRSPESRVSPLKLSRKVGKAF